MTQIVIQNISKNFYSATRGKVKALDDITLTIGSEKFFVLLGPSGCGKSTLLNIIAGIEKPTEGTIKFGDLTVVSFSPKKILSPKERDVAMVFQSYALYPHMTAFENIAFPLKIAKTDKSEINKKVKEVAETLEITEALDAKPSELSGGQRQRVALGRAIIRRPKVLLLDEPLSNLDAMLRISMRRELKEIQKKFGLTTIYVTHDQIEAMSLGDEIAVLKKGEVQQVGKPHKIYGEPENLFVARFLGTPPMNILEYKLFREKKILEEASGVEENSLAAGIRPEEITLVEKDKGKLNGKLRMVGDMGGEKLYYLDVDGNEVLAKTENGFLEGDEVGIEFDTGKIYLFDKKNGKRVER